MSDLIAVFSLLGGAFFMLVASLGLVRFPDLYTRMHAATKATTFGMGGILVATGISFGTPDVAMQSFLALVFLFLTAPTSGHLISRAAYRRGPNLAPMTTVDDYGPYLEAEKKADEEEAARKAAEDEDSDGSPPPESPQTSPLS